VVIDYNFNLTNKVAVITGGASGIGKAIAEAYIQKGANVVILDIHPDVHKIAEELSSKHSIGLKCDITNTNEIDSALQKVIDVFGSLDVLVNSAGIALLAPAESLTDEDWDKTIELNLTASYKMARAAGKIMINRGIEGTIINLASQAALIALEDHVAYTASKSAIIGLTKSLAFEWAKYKITVNAISPTVILTELGKKAWAGEKGKKAKEDIPLKRFGYPEEVASVAIFLAADSSKLITGENIVIDGGNTIK